MHRVEQFEPSGGREAVIVRGREVPRVLMGMAFALGLTLGGDGRSAAPATPAVPDDLVRLRAHLLTLTRLGPRPSGSTANARAAEYLAASLRAAGFDVRIGEGEGRDIASGTAGRVRNVVGWLPSTKDDVSGGRDALLLASHYDSVVDGPGGADNAASVAALLVAAEDLGRSRTRNRPVIVLFSDAEERYLLGADQFVREDPLATRVGGVINFDHAGRAGPLFNFEAGPRSRAMHEALWSLPAFPGAPRSHSFATDVYRVLPFNTDFTVLSRLAVPSLNFGLVRDGYAYHTARDRGEDVPDAALLAIRSTVSGLVDRFVIRGGRLAASGAQDYTTFFPVGRYVVRLTPAALSTFAAVGILLALVALIVVGRRDWRGLARGLTVVLLSLPLTLAITSAAVVGLRAVKGVDQVAYAWPWPLFILLGSMAFVSAILVARWLRVSKLPAATRLGAALIPWAAFAPVATMGIPSSSALFIVPAAGIALAALLALRGRSRAALVVAGLVAVGSVLAVWAEPLGAVLPFLVTTIPKAGPEPLFFWPGLISLLALFLTPLSWALSGPWKIGRWALAAACLFALLGAAGVLARPAYDKAHAQRVWAYHVTAPDTAYEVLASTDRLQEPGATLAPGREARELFWIPPGWSRVVHPSRVRSPLPQISTSRDGGRLVVTVIPPPGADMGTLVLEGATIVSSDPPAAASNARTILRRVAAGTDTMRFAITGSFPPGARARFLCTTPSLPEGAAVAAASAVRSRTTHHRTVTVVEVPLP